MEQQHDLLLSSPLLSSRKVISALAIALCGFSAGEAQAQAITSNITPYTTGTGANTKYFLSSNGTTTGVANTRYEKVTVKVEYYSVGTGGNPDVLLDTVNMTLDPVAAQQNWNSPGVEITGPPPAGQKFYAKAKGTYQKPTPPGGSDIAGPTNSTQKEFP
ncbi:MAG: hypothetical protein ABGY75_07185 [Gemmataceae bacterium]